MADYAERFAKERAEGKAGGDTRTLRGLTADQLEAQVDALGREAREGDAVARADVQAFASITGDDLRAAFSAVDRDNSKQLDAIEFTALMAELGGTFD